MPPLPRPHPWPLAAIVAVALWGASLVAVRVALETFTPFGLVAGRLVLGTALLYGIQRVRGGALLPEAGDRGRAAVLGLVLGGHLSLQAFGLRYTSAIHTGWIIGFTSVAIAVGAHFFLRERMRSAGWGGIVVALLGVGMISGGGAPGFERALLGDGLQVISCLTWAFYSLFGMRPVARSGALRVTAFAMLVALGPLLILTAVDGLQIAAPTVRTIVALVFLGFLCSGVALVLWYAAQRVHGAQRTAATLYLEPFFTVAVAAIVLAEPIVWTTGVGGTAVLLGVWLVKRGTRTDP